MESKTLYIPDQPITYYEDNISKIIKLQSNIRGFNYRKKQMPNLLKYLQKELSIEIKKKDMDDGRMESSINEQFIKDTIKNFIGEKRIEYMPNRSWCDIKIYDYQYGWIVVNIKNSTIKGSDNIGNFSLCLHSYTNIEEKDMQKQSNDHVIPPLIESMHFNNYNMNYKKDYFFFVVNKNTNDIIINSMMKLNKKTPNGNNLPFQIKWKDNQIPKYTPFKNLLIDFEEILAKTPKPPQYKIINYIETKKNNSFLTEIKWEDENEKDPKYKPYKEYLSNLKFQSYQKKEMIMTQVIDNIEKIAFNKFKKMYNL